MVLFLRPKEANIPSLGFRFLVKFWRVGKAIEVKCPTNAWRPPLGLNIDRCISTNIYFFIEVKSKVESRDRNYSHKGRLSTDQNGE